MYDIGNCVNTIIEGILNFQHLNAVFHNCSFTNQYKAYSYMKFKQRMLVRDTEFYLLFSKCILPLVTAYRPGYDGKRLHKKIMRIIMRNYSNVVKVSCRLILNVEMKAILTLLN